MGDEKQLTLAETAALERQQQPTSLYAVFAEMARDTRIEPSRIAQLMELQERAERREAERQFGNALREAQSEMAPIWRNRKNPATNSTFADLEAVDAVARPVYTKHGFALTFTSKPAEKGYATVCCTVMHSGGFAKDYELTGELDTAGPKGGATKTGIQGLGSSVSYLRRYLEAMIWNLIFSDDKDGNSAGWFIDERQVNRILDMLIVTQSNEAKFLEYMQAKAVSDIRKKDFQKAIASLEDKARKMAK